MFAVWTKRTHVAWRLVHKAVPYHLILSLEAFAALTPGAVFDRAVVWAVG